MTAPAERLTSLAREKSERRTALPAEAFERNLTCTRCRGLVAVFEAATGARTPLEHQHVDPAEFVCGACLVGER